MIRYLSIISIIFIFLFIIPIVANAQVVINEIAWMGSNNGGTSGQNSNDEWIELYNNSNNTVNLSGWSLNADDGSPLIVLEGTINAGELFLLERSNDDSAPSVIANLIYTGALSNSGEILRIKDNGGVVIDTVDGTEGWQNIGGDNETKDTAQRVLSGWITASPTPGVQNESSDDSESQQDEEGVQEEETQEEENPEPSSSNPPVISQGSSFPVEQQIFADAGGDRNTIVGADSLFEGKALGLQKKPLANARYVWNFGNGETKEGQNVLHYYQYPGEYVVILNVSSGQYSASDRIIIDAYPAELIISKVDKEFIEIHNKSNRELNLSWWQLQSAGERFILPKDTIILSNKKLIFSSDVTGLDTFVKENVSLLYPNGVEAFSFFQIKIPQKVVATKMSVAEPVQISPQPIITKADPLQEKELEENTIQTASVISSFNNSDDGGSKNSSMSKWLLAIFSIIIVSAGAIIFVGKSKKEPGDEIEIVE